MSHRCNALKGLVSGSPSSYKGDAGCEFNSIRVQLHT